MSTSFGRDQYLDSGKLVSVIMPAFNENGSIEQCLLQAETSLRNSGLNYEIIVVDDGSRDGTFETVEKVAAGIGSIRIFRHEVNKGKSKAIETGLKVSSGDIVCILDADLEYHPADVPRLVAPIMQRRADAVYGSRFSGEAQGMSLSHRLGNVFLTMATDALYGLKLTDVMTGSKAFGRHVLEKIDINSNKFGFEIEATSKLTMQGFKILEIPISYLRRTNGKPKISWIDGLKCLILVFMYKLGKR